MQEVASKGIKASYAPVDWAPSGLPTEPAAIVGAIVDPRQRGELYPLYQQLRERAPVYQCPPELLHGGWLLSRHADVEALLMSPAAVNDPKVVDSAFNHGDGAFYGVMRNTMLFTDAASHKRIRSLVVRVFTPRAIARWQPIAERVAHQLVTDLVADAAGGAETADLVQSFNYQLPFNVIAHILGVPESDFPLVKQLAWDFARAGENMVSPEIAARGDDAARGFLEYFGTLAERRRDEPTDDLISALVQVEADGDRLSLDELVANCVLLMQAGHETTQDLLGNAQVALFRAPEQLALLRQQPEAIKGAVEEFLRFDGSVQIAHRLLLEDLTIDDVTIPAGSIVYPALGAANRDPDRYAEPNRFDVTRAPNHVAFGFGAYYCVGASLARTEAAIGMRTLIERFPGLEPATESFEWRDTLLLRGPLRVDVTW